MNSAKEWREMAALLNQMALKDANNGTYVEGVRGISSRKGYCVPDSMLAETWNIAVATNQSGCSDDLASFVTIPCSDKKRAEHTHCLNPKRIVKFSKCSSNWMETEFEGDSCKCSQVRIPMCLCEFVIFNALDSIFHAWDFVKKLPGILNENN